MHSIIKSLISLFEVIKRKQRATKLRYKNLCNIFSFKQDLKRLQIVQFDFVSIKLILTKLLSFNKQSFILMGITSLVSLVIRIFIAKFNNFLIEYFGSQSSIINLFLTIVILLSFKIIKNILEQWSQYLQMNYGIQCYSAIYRQFIVWKSYITGQVLNIIQDDMQKIINLPYSSLNTLFQTFLVIVISTLLGLTLEEYIGFFIVVIWVLLVATFLSGFLVFKFNNKLMKSKDQRLQLNISSAEKQLIQQARNKQLYWIKKFLFVKIFIKWFIEVAFIIIYVIVFFLQGNNQKNNDLYYQLMLIGMLKTPFSSLFTESYYLALALNSLKRIIICQNRTNQNQTIQSSEIDVDNNKTSENSNPRSFTKAVKNLQKGQIKVNKIFRFIRQNIRAQILVLTISLIIFTFYSKLSYLRITSSIIHNNLSSYQTLIFILPLFIYTLLFITIIILFLKISKVLFSNIFQIRIQGEQLNRISGDIQTVDKYVSTSLYDLTMSMFGFFASIIYSVWQLEQFYIIGIVAVLLMLILYIAVYLNRYFMKSRREIKRIQCQRKSKIIGQLLLIMNQGSPQVNMKKINLYWKTIYTLKNIGILIENSYLFILNLLVVLIQIICLIMCYITQLNPQMTKILLVFIFQIDLTLSSIFLSSITLEMGLINFQRCLNFVKLKLNNNQHSN